MSLLRLAGCSGSSTSNASSPNMPSVTKAWPPETARLIAGQVVGAVATSAGCAGSDRSKMRRPARAGHASGATRQGHGTGPVQVGAVVDAVGQDRGDTVNAASRTRQMTNTERHIADPSIERTNGQGRCLVGIEARQLRSLRGSPRTSGTSPLPNRSHRRRSSGCCPNSQARLPRARCTGIPTMAASVEPMFCADVRLTVGRSSGVAILPPLSFRPSHMIWCTPDPRTPAGALCRFAPDAIGIREVIIPWSRWMRQKEMAVTL